MAFASSLLNRNNLLIKEEDLEKIKSAAATYLKAYTDDTDSGAMYMHKFVNSRYTEPLVFLANLNPAFYLLDKPLEWKHYLLREVPEITREIIFTGKLKANSIVFAMKVEIFPYATYMVRIIDG